MEKQTITYINRQISTLKKNCGIRYYNYFFQYNKHKELVFDVISRPEAITFGVESNGVYRVYFAACDRKILCNLLQEYPTGSVIDYISRDPKEIDFIIYQTGFDTYTTMQRYKLTNLEENFGRGLPVDFFYNYSPDLVTEAMPGDECEIYYLLLDTFDKNISHLPSVQEILQYIKNKEVYVYRSNNEIVMLWMFSRNAKKVYSYQVINKGESVAVWSAWYKGVLTFFNEGILALETWIEVKNLASIRFHTKMGLDFDGVFDRIYIKRR